MLFVQSGSTLTLFADKVTDLHLVIWEVPASAMQSVNQMFIIIFVPIFAALWTKLANRAPRTPVKFAIALMGVGLSATSKLAPRGSSGQLLALWFLSVSVGTSVGGQIGRVTAGNPVHTFVVCAGVTIVIGTALLIFSKKIATLTHDVH